MPGMRQELRVLVQDAPERIGGIVQAVQILAHSPLIGRRVRAAGAGS